MVKQHRRGDRSSNFILKKDRILVQLQLNLTSLHTRVVSLEGWILQIMLWTIITWETSTMVHTFHDTGPHRSHTCPSRHLKVRATRTHVRLHPPHRKATNFVGPSPGHSESAFCSSVTKVSEFMNEWVLVATWKKSVWSTRIDRIAPIWNPLTNCRVSIVFYRGEVRSYETRDVLSQHWVHTMLSCMLQDHRYLDPPILGVQRRLRTKRRHPDSQNPHL